MPKKNFTTVWTALIINGKYADKTASIQRRTWSIAITNTATNTFICVTQPCYQFNELFFSLLLLHSISITHATNDDIHLWIVYNFSLRYFYLYYTQAARRSLFRLITLMQTFCHIYYLIGIDERLISFHSVLVLARRISETLAKK